MGDDLTSFHVESKGVLGDKIAKKQGAPKKDKAKLVSNCRVAVGLTLAERDCVDRHAEDHGLNPAAFVKFILKQGGFLKPSKDWEDSMILISDVKCVNCEKLFPSDQFSSDTKMDSLEAANYKCTSCK
jgi:hypothetical protein